MRKSVVTVQELFWLSITWAACRSAWKNIVVQGFLIVVSAMVPAPLLVQKTIAGILILGVALSMVFAFENVDVGRTKLFTLTRK